MYLGVKQAMKKCISKIQSWFNKNPRIKEYLWFIILWFFGLISVIIFTYPIKYLMKNLSG